MTKQPRDKNGRFVGKENGVDWFGAIAWAIITFIILFAVVWAYHDGYTSGYQTGLSENQPTIYQNGFDDGATQQKNIDELARNWTACSWWTRDDSVYCRNDNPDRVRTINSDYSIDFEYTMPDWSEYYYSETTCNDDNAYGLTVCSTKYYP